MQCKPYIAEINCNRPGRKTFILKTEYDLEPTRLPG
jgi:hypothetical protein